MSITREHFLPKNRLSAAVFDRALVFTNTKERTQQIARALLVEHYLPSVVASKFDTTKQNVYRASAQLVADARQAQAVFTELAKQWNRLSIPDDVGRRALPFLMQEVTLHDAAKDAGCEPQEVIEACKAAVLIFQATAHSDLAEKEAHFRHIMRYSRARDKAFRVSYDGFVLGMSFTELAAKHGITRQNAYNIMQRFYKTQEQVQALR